MEENSGAVLTEEGLQAGLGCLGRHPIHANHAYLELNVSGRKTIVDISVLSKYKQLMYLDISSNAVVDLSVLSGMSALTQLKAQSNQIDKCLAFSPPLCRKDNAWSTGHQAVGSMLSSVDLSDNRIAGIGDLSNHRYLEILLLGKNVISKIDGVGTLLNLKVLDLSYNKIKTIDGLSGLNIQELNLRGNCIEKITNLGSNYLPKLSVLDIAENKIKSLKPLEACEKLSSLDVRDNQLEFLRQVEFLADLQFLEVLMFLGNPASKKPFYRRRIIYRLASLSKLDFTKISSEEKVRAFNLYPTLNEDGTVSNGEGNRFNDLQKRMDVFCKYIPHQEYIDFSASLQDEELELTLDELMLGETFAMRDEKLYVSEILRKQEAEMLVETAVDAAVNNTKAGSQQQQQIMLEA